MRRESTEPVTPRDWQLRNSCMPLFNGHKNAIIYHLTPQPSYVQNSPELWLQAGTPGIGMPADPTVEHSGIIPMAFLQWVLICWLLIWKRWCVVVVLDFLYQKDERCGGLGLHNQFQSPLLFSLTHLCYCVGQDHQIQNVKDYFFFIHLLLLAKWNNISSIETMNQIWRRQLIN